MGVAEWAFDAVDDALGCFSGGNDQELLDLVGGLKVCEEDRVHAGLVNDLEIAQVEHDRVVVLIERVVHVAPATSPPLPWVSLGTLIVIVWWAIVSVGFYFYLTGPASYDSVRSRRRAASVYGLVVWMGFEIVIGPVPGVR